MATQLELTAPVGARSPVDVYGSRQELAESFAARGFTLGAEIGVEQGLYSEVLLEVNPRLHLLAVDAWQAYRGYREHVTQAKLDVFYEATKRRLARFHGRVALKRAWSVDAAKSVPDGSLDFVYLDGNHELSQVIADLYAWVPKVRVGGIVAGHDYRKVKGTGPFHVPYAVQAYAGAHRISPWFVLRGDSAPSWLWVQA